MKAVILAAGSGKRLRPITEELPKCLVEIDGKSLLGFSLNSLKECGINNVIIVIGFYGNSIKEKFGEEYKGIKLKYIENDIHSKTGSMYSLFQAKKFINEDIILLESDLLYDKKAIKIMLNSKYKDVILVAKLLNRNDDVYICTNDKKEIVNIGKNIPEEEKKKSIGALVGISKYSKEFLSKLFKNAEQDFANSDLIYHYEETVLATSKLGNPVYAEFCEDLNWIEIDNENDLKIARQDIYPKIEGSNNAAN